MTSAELDARMVLLLEQHRQVVWFRAGQAAEDGWPDWMLLGPGGLIFRVTRGRGDCSRQFAVGFALRALGFDWAFWHEEDLTSGAIEAQITAISKLAKQGVPA